MSELGTVIYNLSRKQLKELYRFGKLILLTFSNFAESEYKLNKERKFKMFNHKVLTIAFAFFFATVFMYANVAEAQFVEDGLVSWWSFDKETISGETVKDGFGDNDGTIEGDPEIVAGKIGDCLLFDGDDFVTIPHSESLDIGEEEFSLEAWIKAPAEQPVSWWLNTIFGKGGTNWKAGYSYVPGWGKVDELLLSGKIDLYDGEICFIDSLIEEVLYTLEECQILEESVIILTADHGEQLGQHGVSGHSGVHEADIYVPLIMWGPDIIPSDKEVRGFAQHIDIAPTVLELVEAEELPFFDGESLLPIIKGEKKLRERVALEDQEQRAYLKGEWKYIKDYWTKKEALYNIESDPCEVVNLIHERKEIAQKLRNSLSLWVQENLKEDSDPLLSAAQAWREAFREFLGREFPSAPAP